MADGAIVLGSSTGGAAALSTVLADLQEVKQPIFIVQHLPDTMGDMLAAQLPRCRIMGEGDIVTAGTVYLVPGGQALTVQRFGADMRIGLQPNSRDPIDATLCNLAAVYGTNLRAAILTGMDRDGARGVAGVLANGGQAFAQSNALVMSMPNAAMAAGAISLPLAQLGRALQAVALEAAA